MTITDPDKIERGRDVVIDCESMTITPLVDVHILALRSFLNAEWWHNSKYFCLEEFPLPYFDSVSAELHPDWTLNNVDKIKYPKDTHLKFRFLEYTD